MPRPIVRFIAVAFSGILLIVIMTTQYSSNPVMLQGVAQDSGSGDVPSENVGLNVKSDEQGIIDDENLSIQAEHHPAPYMTLHVDETLNLQRDKYANPAVPLVADIPSIVHFVWCGQRFLEFKHYLSLQAIIRVLKADKVVFHYEIWPQIDQLLYHQWFMDLVHDFPFLHMEQLSEYDLVLCKAAPSEQKTGAILAMLNLEGGFYVSENTWLMKLELEDRQLDIYSALDTETMDGFLGIKRGIATNATYVSLTSETGIRRKRSICTSIGQLYGGVTDPQCLIVRGGRYDAFFPMQIWDLDDPFGRLSRRIFYGTENILQPTPSYDELVPNIGHMIWLGGGPMDFVFYLSALSMIYVVEVDTLYIHGDYEPTGEYWPQLKKNDRVKFVLRPQPTILYTGQIEWYYRALMSDAIRADLMIKYGGIYTDTDAIWVKPLTHEDRGYEAVASYDWVDWSYPYPDSVNLGVSYGKRNAPFWHIWRESFRQLHNDLHGFTGVMMPYKLLEKHPDLMRIDRHLQVICYKFRCHPTYVANYHDENNDHVVSNSIPNWKEDVYAFHWTHPNPPEYANKTALLASTGMFAEIGQFVLQKAGLL